ncbi:MAG: AAA family ATPase, partial [Candidatus Pacebacteria bacterium]|nr:AAA family ATPase [Candidatus Paceibacterota bacterium]
MDQEKAFEIMKSGENVFLTGSAGTGKTFLLNSFINHLKKNKVHFGITAS